MKVLFFMVLLAFVLSTKVKAGGILLPYCSNFEYMKIKGQDIYFDNTPTKLKGLDKIYSFDHWCNAI